MAQEKREKILEDGNGGSASRKWLILLAACFGFMMLNIDTFIVNVTLPAIGHEFHTFMETPPGPHLDKLEARIMCLERAFFRLMIL